MSPKYKRVLIKLSGEALAGKQGHGLDEDVISSIVEEIKTIHDLGVEIALVIGAGNFCPSVAPCHKAYKVVLSVNTVSVVTT